MQMNITNNSIGGKTKHLLQIAPDGASGGGVEPPRSSVSAPAVSGSKDTDSIRDAEGLL